MVTNLGVTLVTLCFWAFVNYFVAKAVDNSTRGLNVHPWYYVIGSFIFGGVLPLIFLAVKYLVHKFK
jgi:hypothetical protein